MLILSNTTVYLYSEATMKIKNLAIYGANSLPNTLLGEFLEKHSYTVQIHQTPESTLHYLADTPSPLVLIDHNTGSTEELVPHCLSTPLGKSGKLVLAVFNVDNDDTLRKLARLPLVNGVFTHDCPQDMLLKGIAAMLKGEIWLPRYILEEHLVKHRVLRSSSGNADANLTERESEILGLLATGARNTDIADALNLSPHTVKTHIYNIFKKINASNRMQAVNWAKEHLNSY